MHDHYPNFKMQVIPSSINIKDYSYARLIGFDFYSTVCFYILTAIKLWIWNYRAGTD